MASPASARGTGSARAVLLAAMLAAAGFSARAQHAIVEPYQDSAGLTSMGVQSLAQAADGVMWVSTENGLFRFDGFRMQREPLPAGVGSEVDAALADRRGWLWVAIENHLFLRREVDGAAHWTPVVRPDGRPLQVAGSQRFTVDDRGLLFAMDYDSRLWSIALSAAGAGPLVASPVALPPFDPYRGSVEAAGGPVLATGADLWFACGSGLCRWRGGQLSTWGPPQGLASGMWASLLVARDGSLWARSSDRLAHLAPGAAAFESLPAPPARIWPANIALVQDREGAIVTATDDGIARWDGRHWRQWTPREGLPETAVRALLMDLRGELWLGNAGRGVHHWIGYGDVEHWTPELGLPAPVVWSFARDGAGRLCAATARGVACLDEERHRFRPVRSEAAPSVSTHLAVDAHGSLWWVQDGRLLTLAPGAATARTALRDDSLAYVVQGIDSIWLVGANGAQRLLTDAPVRRMPPPPGMPDPITLDQLVSDGTHEWFLVGAGAYRLDGQRWVPLLDTRGRPLRLGTTATFTGPSELWNQDADGIGIYSVRDDVARPAGRIAAAALGGAELQFLRADTGHRVWVGTDQGLFVRQDGQWAHLDRDNGLPLNDIDGGAFLLDADGSAWIGTSAGAVRLLPGHLRVRAAPTLRLDGLQLGDRVVHGAPASAVPWRDRRVRATFGTPDIARGRSMRLEYRLRGDEPWQSLQGNVLQLESLEPAAYRLQVRVAAAGPTDRPGPPIDLPFVIAPPWWRSLGARLGYAAALAGLWALSLVVLRRRAHAARVGLERAIAERTAELEQSHEAVRQLGAHNAQSLEAERTRVSRELHDEMGQQLAALRMEVAVLGRQTEGGHQPGRGAFALLLERVDGVVASMRRVVSQLRPPALDGGLAAAIQWLASEFTRQTGLPCEPELDDCARRLPADLATMTFRIAQESLNNVRNHARATRVQLRLRGDDGACVLLVRDDGAGFDVQAPRTGYGLLGMAERARAAGCTLSVDSAPGAGTTVRLRVPVTATR